MVLQVCLISSAVGILVINVCLSAAPTLLTSSSIALLRAANLSAGDPEIEIIFIEQLGKIA